MKKPVLIICFSFIITTVFSYPISPRPLRKLVIESEYIIWGKVIKTGETVKSKKDYDPWDREYALVAITDKIQGSLREDTVQVFFCSGMICPAPGILYDDEAVLIFLDKRDKRPGYQIHALSYGVKHGLSQDDYLVYKKRILEMQEFVKAKQADVCSPAMTAWLMKCAEMPATRWDGLYEINPQSDFMSFYERGELACKDSYVNTAHRKMLFDILLAVDTLSYSDMMLVDITAGTNDSAVLVFLKKQLLLADSEEGYYWMANTIMEHIAALAGNAELDKLVKEFDRVYYNFDDKSKADARRIYKQFVEKMQLCGLKKTATAAGNQSVFIRRAANAAG